MARIASNVRKLMSDRVNILLDIVFCSAVVVVDDVAAVVTVQIDKYTENVATESNLRCLGN
jgi:Na+/H+ antiporter NhaA